MASEHIVRSYDEELKRLNNRIAEMGGLAEAQLAAGVQALVKRDIKLAERVVATDRQLDQMESDIDTHVVRLLALRQPMAIDLRAIVVSLKIASDLERIGDYAKNIAKRAIALSQSAPAAPIRGVPRMSRMVESMIHDVLDAYVRRDVDRAVAVWNRDGEVDDAYTGMFRELLTYMMEDPRNITACTHLLFIAKNIERIGDHTTNIAENIYFLVKGQSLDDPRPKGEDASKVIAPDAGDPNG